MLPSLLLSLAVLTLVCGEDYVHAPIHYHSQTDAGTYNFGYDTGLSGSHQFHQEYKDISGQVKGRYGYTDPYGKLRVVYYTSGPQGYRVVSDSGSSAPPGNVNTIERYRSPQRTPHKRVYSNNYYRNFGRLQSTSSRYVSRRKPHRSYRESGSENSRIYMAGRDYGSIGSHRYREERPVVRVESPRPHYHRIERPIFRESPRSQFHRARPETSYETSAIRRQTQPIIVPTRSATSGNYEHLHKPYSYEVPVSPPETHVRESVSVSHVPSVHNDISDSLSLRAPSPIAIPPVVVPASPYARPPVVYSGRGILSPSARLKLGAPRPVLSAPSSSVERSVVSNTGADDEWKS